LKIKLEKLRKIIKKSIIKESNSSNLCAMTSANDGFPFCKESDMTGLIATIKKFYKTGHFSNVINTLDLLSKVKEFKIKKPETILNSLTVIADHYDHIINHQGYVRKKFGKTRSLSQINAQSVVDSIRGAGSTNPTGIEKMINSSRIMLADIKYLAPSLHPILFDFLPAGNNNKAGKKPYTLLKEIEKELDNLSDEASTYIGLALFLQIPREDFSMYITGRANNLHNERISRLGFIKSLFRIKRKDNAADFSKVKETILNSNVQNTDLVMNDFDAKCKQLSDKFDFEFFI
jgi:hypothetical protein